MPDVTLGEMPKKTPGQLLAELLKQKEIDKSEFARALGTIYVTVNRWTNDEGFNEKNRRRAARELGLTEDYFERPDEYAVLNRRREEAFAAFVKNAELLGYIVTDSERRTLAGTPFFDAPPTPELYMAWFLSLRGHIPPKEVAKVAAENAEAKRAITQKGDPFVRKPR